MSSGLRPGRPWHSHDVLHLNPDQLNRLFRYLSAFDAEYRRVKDLQRELPDVTDDHILAYMILRRIETLDHAIKEIGGHMQPLVVKVDRDAAEQLRVRQEVGVPPADRQHYESLFPDGPPEKK